MVQAPPILLSLATVALTGFLKTPELELGDEQEWSGDYEVLLEILVLKLGTGANNQNGNLRWYLPWRAGGLEGVSSATYLFWKMIFFKTI